VIQSRCSTVVIEYVDVIVIDPVIVAVHVHGNETVIVIWPVDVLHFGQYGSAAQRTALLIASGSSGEHTTCASGVPTYWPTFPTQSSWRLHSLVCPQPYGPGPHLPVFSS
jgi:hypothetical protein